MKLLTLNFLSCARKACRSSPASFPLHPRAAELERIATDPNPRLLVNLLPRLDWNALRGVAEELGLSLAASPEEATQEDLHSLLLETCIVSGGLVCANCGHEYPIKEGIANFLLPSHLV